jgi:DNA polymerase (family 10)
LGLQTEKNIIRGIEKLKKRSGKIRLGIALPLAQKFLDYLLERPSIISDAAITGSVRRGKAMVSDIDLLLASNNPEAVYEYVKSYKAIRQVDFFNNDLIKGQLSGGIKFEIIIATPSDYYYKLVWTTGSKDHREHLFSSNRCQVYKNFNSENEVYTRMGMDFIVPELREDEGEIEAAINGSLPKLITNNQIKGDLHVHTNWSDGSERIEDIAVAAYQKGYEYIAITDHSKSLKISGGLSEEMLINQGKVIDALNMDTSRDDFSILKGTEVDILKTGELDFPDPILEQLDIVIASVHSNFKMDKIEQTERIIQAIKNENVDIIGHLTGRLLSRRSGYEIEIDDIIDACARYNTALEINSHPDRMDINDKIARKARECGVKIAINSDAHRKKELDLISYGVTTARRGWLETKDVLNACSRDELLNRL